MAQTRRKRRTKHRGTAAGTIATRGRTGRPPTEKERKSQSRTEARERRLSTPPTWKNSSTRAGLAAALMFAFVLLTDKKHQIAPAVLFALFAFVIYVPAGFYIEQFLYHRRQRKKELANR